VIIGPTHLAPSLHPRFPVILIGLTCKLQAVAFAELTHMRCSGFEAFQESTSAFAPPLASDLEQHEK
jgi:hypothetical protein